MIIDYNTSIFFYVESHWDMECHIKRKYNVFSSIIKNFETPLLALIPPSSLVFMEMMAIKKYQKGKSESRFTKLGCVRSTARKILLQCQLNRN